MDVVWDLIGLVRSVYLTSVPDSLLTQVRSQSASTPGCFAGPPLSPPPRMQGGWVSLSLCSSALAKCQASPILGCHRHSHISPCPYLSVLPVPVSQDMQQRCRVEAPKPSQDSWEGCMMGASPLPCWLSYPLGNEVVLGWSMSWGEAGSGGPVPGSLYLVGSGGPNSTS